MLQKNRTHSRGARSANRDEGLLAAALFEPQWCGDGEPLWERCKTAAQAEAERLKLVRFFEKHDEDWLSNSLEECSLPDSPCFSGACPACGRAVQRWLEHHIRELLKKHFPEVPVSAISMILGENETLNSDLLAAYKSKAKRKLSEAGVKHAFGGWDISFNQNGWDDPGRWSLHLWALVPKLTDEKKRLLRSTLRASDSIPRPLKALAFDGRAEAIAYAFKTDFARRVSLIGEKGSADSARTCRNTTDQKLRTKERLELYRFLDAVGLAGRIFLMGARVVRTANGPAIRPVNKRT